MGYKALYRQLRPDNFDDVIGQDHLVNTLKAQIMRSKISHAYLFCGPRGIGKTTVARIMAKAINCQSPVDGNMCGKCSTCVALNDPANLDIIEIDAASNNKVDDVRDLRENIKFMPAAGKYRVYIIDEVHMLSNSAFNALLKTLEEPPAHIVFILATTEPNKLPITVLSRCQRFDFKRVSTEDITKLLTKISSEKGIDIDENAIVTIARFSEGGVRDAISLLDQSSMFVDEKITVAHVYELLGSANKLMYFALSESILNRDIKRALLGFNKMLESGCNINTVAHDIIQHFRDLYMAKYVNDVGSALNTDDASAARYIKQSKTASDAMLVNCIEIFAGVEMKIRQVNNPKIWLELAISKACMGKSEDSYEELLLKVDELETKLKNAQFTQVKVVEKTVDVTKSEEIKELEEIDEKEYFPYEDAPEETAPIENDDYDIGFPEPPMEDAEFEVFDNMPDVPTNNEIEAEPQKASEPEELNTDDDFLPQEKEVSLFDKVNMLVDSAEAPSDVEEKGSSKKSSGSLNHRQVWKKAIKLLTEQKKKSLTTAMEKCKPISCDNGVFTVQVDTSATYYGRLSTNANMKLIIGAIKESCGKDVRIEYTNVQISEEGQNFMDTINNAFGGDKDLVNTKF